MAVQAHNYRFTVSDQARANMEAAVSEGNNVVDFMASKGYLNFFTEAETSTKELYAAYKLWCEDNAHIPLAQRSFSQHLTENQETYHIRPTNNIYIGNGRRARGYLGIEPAEQLPLHG